MNKKQKYEESIATLDGMEQIILNEKLTHGTYCSPGEIFDWVEGENAKTTVLREQGAICGGNNMCAVGSLVWANFYARGVKPIPGQIAKVSTGGRAWEGSMKYVYRKLNKASEKWALKNEASRISDYLPGGEDYVLVLDQGWMEVLFEYVLPGGTSPNIATKGQSDYEVMLKLIRKTRKKIQKKLDALA